MTGISPVVTSFDGLVQFVLFVRDDRFVRRRERPSFVRLKRLRVMIEF